MRVIPLARGHRSSSTGPAAEPAFCSASSGLAQHPDDLRPDLTLFGHASGSRTRLATGISTTTTERSDGSSSHRAVLWAGRGPSSMRKGHTKCEPTASPPSASCPDCLAQHATKLLIESLLENTQMTGTHLGEHGAEERMAFRDRLFEPLHRGDRVSTEHAAAAARVRVVVQAARCLTERQQRTVSSRCRFLGDPPS